mmetsp:Transcript_22847/g.20075  ORF Transcript_22847/g.20075 Transcript_22847/m.20075 type:complete len:347 (+) Transcript_22847:68-1108(+)
MGQNFCSCSVQYIKGYDDLPDRITEHSAMRKNSMVSFKSHKIVTTISLAPIPDSSKPQHHHSHHHHHRHSGHHGIKHIKYKHSKQRKQNKHHKRHDDMKTLSITINETESSQSDDGLNLLPPIALENMNGNCDESLINETMMVMYREGFCEGDDGESLIPMNTITRRSLTEMDIDGISNILSNKLQLNHIISRCPERYHFMKWKCLYSLLNHGCSMQTFYRNTEDMQQSVLIIKDQSNNIFGAFLDSKWKAEYHHYTGSNECFVYKFHFEANEYSVFEYHHTGDKPYFVQSDYDGITIGAGECPAIYIQNDLLLGRTTKSDTFTNEALSSSIFKIKDIEIWCPHFE